MHKKICLELIAAIIIGDHLFVLEYVNAHFLKIYEATSRF